MQPLYGHTSPETAYLVADYPYGRKVRCRLRAWVEDGGNRGFRFVTQTEHPTRKVWNAPKKSTYVLVAACMYLDEKGHVQWQGVSEYTDAKEALAFARSFPQCNGRDSLLAWAVKKCALAAAFASGKAYMTINGEKVEYSETEKAAHQAESAVWREVIAALKG